MPDYTARELMAVAAARHRGAEQVVAIDAVPERLELARTFGARPLDYRSESPLEVLREMTEGRGADAVLEDGTHPAFSIGGIRNHGQHDHKREHEDLYCRDE